MNNMKVTRLHTPEIVAKNLVEGYFDSEDSGEIIDYSLAMTGERDIAQELKNRVAKLLETGTRVQELIEDETLDDQLTDIENGIAANRKKANRLCMLIAAQQPIAPPPPTKPNLRLVDESYYYDPSN